MSEHTTGFRIDNGGHHGKSADWTPDTRCAICGRGFEVGDRAWVRCAVNPADAVWEHDSCSDAVLAKLEERL